MPFKDKEKQKIWRKEYRIKNKVQIRSKEKEYYHNTLKHSASYVEYGKIHRRKFETRFKRAIRASKKRKIEFNLTFDQYCEEISKPCIYCNNLFECAPSAGVGLDRIDNTMGYVISNVCSCCYICNRVKGDNFSFKETLAAIKTILLLRGK